MVCKNRQYQFAALSLIDNHKKGWFRPIESRWTGKPNHDRYLRYIISVINFWIHKKGKKRWFYSVSSTFHQCRRPESNQNTFLKPLKRKEILRIPPKSVQKVFNACSTTFPIFLSYKNKNLKQSYKISSHILYFTENKNAINYYS